MSAKHEDAELQRLVALRTRDLVEANESLMRELAELRRQSARRDLDFRLIVDSIPLPVAVTTPSGDVEGLNQATIDYFGKPLEELKGWKASDVVHPDDLERTVSAQMAAHSAGESYNIESRHRRADGVYRWFNVVGLPLRDADGQILRWLILQIDIDDRRRAEDARREAERELRLVIDSIPGLVAVAGPDGELQSANRQMIDYFGLAMDNLKAWRSLLHEDDVARVANELSTSIESGVPFDVEHRLLRADGAFRWFSSRGLPVRDTTGNIRNWYFLLTDIDERRRAEDALRESEREARLIVDRIPAGAALMAPSGELEAVNKQMLDYFGKTFEELRRWITAGDEIHPEDFPRAAEAARHALSTGEPFDIEERLLRFDGVYRWFHVRGLPITDADGRVRQWCILHIDIDDRKRTEAELKQAYRYLEEAQQLSRTGSFRADVVADDHVWSDELYRIFEFELRCKVSVEAVRAIINPEDLPAFDAGFARSAAEGSDFDQVFRIVTRSGKTKHLHASARVSGHVEGRPVFIGAIQDVTETRIAEQTLDKVRSELAHATRAVSLGVLTASIAHEVNQPLSGVITNANTCLRMLSEDPPIVEGARETSRRIIRDSNRAAEVIARLRALFSKKEFAIEPFDLNEAAREVIALSRQELHRSRIAIHSQFEDRLPPVAGDRVQVQQVILNLLLNAADSLKCVEDRPRQIFVETGRQDDGVRLTVRDTGVGIAAAAHGKVFDAFFTTKADGMGIGLSVSRSIIERHQGRLWTSHEGGPGAAFSFSVPCADLGDGPFLSPTANASGASERL